MTKKSRESIWALVAIAGLASFGLALPGLGAAAAVEETVEAASAEQPAEHSLAQKPYMGWSSYSMQVYSGNGKWITADQLIAQSDAMHEKLQPYGYEYINIDAGWNGGIDEYGRPVPSDDAVPGRPAGGHRPHPRQRPEGRALHDPGHRPAGVRGGPADLGAPECTTGDIVEQPLQQADYWGIGYRIDFSNPCAQAYIDSIADLFARVGRRLPQVRQRDARARASATSRSTPATTSRPGRRRCAPHDIWFELSWALDISYADYWKQ